MKIEDEDKNKVLIIFKSFCFSSTTPSLVESKGI